MGRWQEIEMIFDTEQNRYMRDNGAKEGGWGWGMRTIGAGMEGTGIQVCTLVWLQEQEKVER